MDSPETLAHWEQDMNVRENPRAMMNGPETLATLGTRHITLEKTVEGNDEWTVQRHWQHWEQDI